MYELALFAGAGGGILGGHMLGWRTVCAVELEPYAASVLLQRQNDKLLPPFPIWDDVCTFDGRPWRGIVDVVSGGFPCQDISSAGKGAGIEGSRSGLWAEMFRIICEVRPRFAFMENSPLLTSRGLHRVLGDLAESGYNAAWTVLGADDVGAPHRRKRIWILAEDARNSEAGNLAHTGGERLEESGGDFGIFKEEKGKRPADKPAERSAFEGQRFKPWAVEPRVGRVVDGVAARVDRLKAIGNGQVPLVAATAFRILREQLNHANHESA